MPYGIFPRPLFQQSWFHTELFLLSSIAIALNKVFIAHLTFSNVIFAMTELRMREVN